MLRICKPRRIAANHPALEGHFPGKPVVPGVLLLSAVFDELALQFPHLTVTGIQRVKFLKALLPEEDFQVELQNVGGEHIAVRCLRGDLVILDAKLLVASSG
jgi:3-hydroxyacyl-[acyl-carrier-protein] dehydratase